MEKSNLEILKEFAKSTNRSIIDTEIPYPKTGYRTFVQYKRMIYIPNNKENTSYFVFFSDPYAKVGMPTDFCGAFIKLPAKYNSELNIRSKNILDKVNVFSNTKSNKIGSDYFDSKTIISGNLDHSLKSLLLSMKIQNQLSEALKIEELIRISINEYKIDFIPELKGSPYLSIINPQSWNLDESFIEQVFTNIEKTRDIIYNN